ncbi:MAG TPA: hypothetical protein VMX16_12035 [Terriglobia bacterium]|nr:hypothetical protein [Terriglobia bacterium]
MIPHLRKDFNARFMPQKYRHFLTRLEAACGTPIQFRTCETPCFFPKPLLNRMAQCGDELLQQLFAEDSPYQEASRAAVPPEFNVPGETAHPLFVQADFGLARDDAGELRPRLVEIQGFPSLYAYQETLAREYVESYGLDPGLKFLLSGLDLATYRALLHRAILGGHAPENVALLEINPRQQKTLPDFLLTERIYGIPTVNLLEVEKQGRTLFYRREGKQIPIRRIYNRVIADDLVRKKIQPPFDFRDELDVEWAGHPNWFFRLSKFSIPYLRHPCVPRTWFLDQLPELPGDPGNYVLKPLFSFSGIGVIVGPSRDEIEAIPHALRSQYILQERVRFEPVIETPFGPTLAELRIMYIWLDSPVAGPILVRTGRGKMMGVDHNRNLEWVGASAGLYLEE